MSPTQTTTAAATPATPMQAAENRVTAVANNVPQLIAGFKAIDSPLGTALEGKAAIWSKTQVGHVVLLILSGLVAKYGLNWADQTQQDVAYGAMVLAQGAYGIVIRFWTSGRITGFFTRKPISAAPLPASTTGTAS